MTGVIRPTLFATLLLATAAYADPPATPHADRLNQLITELTAAQARGDEARVRQIAAEMEALSPRVKGEMDSTFEAARRQAPSDMQQRMQNQMEAMRQAKDSPEWQISLAARRGDLAEVKRLRKAGADLNVYRLDPGPPLMEAAAGGHLEVAKYLLDQGAQMRISKSIVTLDALRLAAEAREDNSAMLKLLVARGALKAGDVQNIGSAMLEQAERRGLDHAGVTANQITSGSALTAAIEKGRVGHVKTLLALGANANDWSNGRSALMLAARKLQPQMVELLLRHGADPSLTGQDRKTALQLAEATRETRQNAERRGAVIRRLRGS
jgi:hypothetical protein